jgi:hypothetical protein
MKSEWKWFIPVAAAFVLGGTLLGARNASSRRSDTAGRYPAPEVSVAAQRIVLPWESAQRNPEVREKLGLYDSNSYGSAEQKPKKKRHKRKKSASVPVPGPIDKEMGLMAADDPDLKRAEHYSPKEDSKPAHYEPEWKDWAPG